MRKTKWGGSDPTAAPYTLIVPAQYPKAMHLTLPEYSWAQGLQVARYSLRLACDNASGHEPMPLELERAVEQLESFRRVHRLVMIPPSDYYLANCRTLHTVDASGPTAVAGWKCFVAGEPFCPIAE